MSWLSETPTPDLVFWHVTMPNLVSKDEMRKMGVLHPFPLLVFGLEMPREQAHLQALLETPLCDAPYHQGTLGKARIRVWV